MYLNHSHMFISVLLFSTLALTSSSQLCNPYDKKVLLQIKKQLGNPSSLNSWTSDTDCCLDWLSPSNMDCNKQGHVTSLMIGSLNDISSEMPQALGHLTYLQTLLISEINFSGQISKYICQLTNLSTLLIVRTNLTGPIPNCLALLKNLNLINLGFNKLTGNIPGSSLAQLTNLASLSLHSNELTGTIPPVLGELRNLDTIQLYSNNLYGTIPPSFGLLPNLTKIDISSNKLTGYIPASFGSYKNIMDIKLNDNLLTGVVPRSMSQITAWRVDLSDNRLTGDASFLFARNKTDMEVVLYISNNHFNFDFTNVELPQNLVELNISHNMIYGSLPNQLAEVPLRLIDVSYNKLCGLIPTSQRLIQFSPAFFSHNKCLCGPPLPPCNKA